MARRMIEKRRRGFFGWIFMIVFLGWNAVMAYATFSGLMASADGCAKLTGAELSGCQAGTGLGFMFLLIFWAVGSVVTGLLVLTSRGTKELIEVEA